METDVQLRNRTDVEDLMTAPSEALSNDLAMVDGDILVLGAGGKMGPTLARLAKRAAPDKRVVAVARFSDPTLRDVLEGHGVETLTADLLDEDAVASLPKLPNVIFMAGRKFGSQGAEHLTWAINVHVPALVAKTFRESRIVAMSTGCVYAFAPISAPSDENAPLTPPGEYANSCIGRERMFEHFSRKFGTPGRLVRLNYAIDMEYGVLRDIAGKVLAGEPIDLKTGHVNIIWQGDANTQILRCLRHATSPTSPINISGPVVSVRWLAEAFAERLGREPVFVNTEAERGWVVGTSASRELFGPPDVSYETMIDWTVDWVSGHPMTPGKPTHFEVRDGTY